LQLVAETDLLVISV